MMLYVSKLTFIFPSSVSKRMNNHNNNRNNNSLITTVTQFRNDFCSWVRGHENLYKCLLQFKHFMLDNRTITLCCILFLYHRFNMRYFILFLYYRFIMRTNY
jgi:hypothetical protein